MPTEGLRQRLDAQHDRIMAIAREHGVKRLWVFGSVARGTAGPHSDIDFMAEFDADRSIFDLSGLFVDLGELLGCKVDVVTPGGLKPHLCDQVLREAIPL